MSVVSGRMSVVAIAEPNKSDEESIARLCGGLFFSGTPKSKANPSMGFEALTPDPSPTGRGETQFSPSGRNFPSPEGEGRLACHERTTNHRGRPFHHSSPRILHVLFLDNSGGLAAARYELHQLRSELLPFECRLPLGDVGVEAFLRVGRLEELLLELALDCEG